MAGGQNDIYWWTAATHYKREKGEAKPEPVIGDRLN